MNKKKKTGGRASICSLGVGKKKNTVGETKVLNHAEWGGAVGTRKFRLIWGRKDPCLIIRKLKRGGSKESIRGKR